MKYLLSIFLPKNCKRCNLQSEAQRKDEVGLYERPAGMLAKLAKELDGIITIEKNSKCVDATKLFALMGLGIVKGDTIIITIQDAEQAGKEVEIEKN